MPITKCEASRATPTKGIEYIMDPEKVIASGSQGLLSDNPEKMAKQMLLTMYLFGKGYDFDERKYYHAKVSFDPADRPETGGTLTTESANRYAAKYAKKLWPNREVVWAVQDHGASIHIHFIVAACEQTTGKKLDARDAEYRGWKDYANTLAAEFGLSALDWRKATKEKRACEKNCEEIECVTFSEVEMRRKNKVVWKDELRSIIDSATAECCDMQTFRSALEKNGVALTRCTEQIISYKLREHKACRGDTLGGDYTLWAIQNALEHNAQHSKPELFDEIDFDSRKKYRSWGRMAGMKREEIDKLCDELPRMSWHDKQLLWEEYKEVRDSFWIEYEQRKNRVQEKLDATYAARRRAKDAEWILSPYNRRKSLGSIIFAGIYLHRYGGSKQYDACIEDLKQRQENLRKDARRFKTHSNAVVNTLKSRMVSLDEYTDALLFMKDMADDINMTGSKAMEYWAAEYEQQHQLRMPGTQSLEEMLENSKKRSEQDAGLYQIQKVDWTKL